MNTATMLHRTAMEFYDLAGIYKAKGKTDFFEDYRKRAWLLEKEAAFQMLAEMEEYTFKYLVIKSAGLLGYENGYYEEAKKILELGIMRNPPKAEKVQMLALIEKIKGELKPIKNKERAVNLGNFISGTLTAADIEHKKIKIRENGKSQQRSIFVPGEMIKKIVRFYLGELVTLQLDKDKSGSYFLKNITKAA